MNRSILIVICDFLVSAMLSLTPGVSVGSAPGMHGAVLDSRTAAIVLDELRNEQARLAKERQALLDARARQGAQAERDAAIRAMTRRLAETQAQSEMLARKLALRPENSGALSPEQLQKQLEKEIENRFHLNLRHQDAVQELERMREDRRAAAEEYTALRENYAVRQAELARAQRTLGEREKALNETRTNLEQSREVLAVREAALKQTRTELQTLDRRSAELAGRNRQVEADRAFLRGELSAKEKELAEARSRSELLLRQENARKLELAEAGRKLEQFQSVMKNAVSESSKKQAELAAVRQDVQDKARELSRLGGELAALKARLAAAEEKLRSDVLERYAQSVAKLKMKLRETRMLIPQTIDAEYFLPVVQIGGRNCLVGDFLLLTGNTRDRQNYDNLTDLAYAIAPADGKGAAQALSGPIYVPPVDGRVGLLEVPDSVAGRKPLELLTVSKLRKRGIQDLYLFKFSAFGKESAALEKRCSMNLSGGDSDLYIRNAARGTGSELRAEPGDFVLTKQGEFVGVVTSVVNSDFGRRQEARCAVFPDDFDWKQARAVPFARSPESDYLESFARAAAPILREIRARDGERRE